MDKGEVAERVLQDTGRGANAREQLLLIREVSVAGSRGLRVHSFHLWAVRPWMLHTKLWEEQSGARGAVWAAAFGWLLSVLSSVSPSRRELSPQVCSVFTTRAPTPKVRKPVGGSFFDNNLACWRVLSPVHSRCSFLDLSSWFWWSILCRGAFLSGVSHYFVSGILECCSRLRVQSCVNFHLYRECRVGLAGPEQPLLQAVTSPVPLVSAVG